MRNKLKEAYYSNDPSDEIELPDSIGCECGADMYEHNDKWVCSENAEPKNDEDFKDVEYCESINVNQWIEDRIHDIDADYADYMAE